MFSLRAEPVPDELVAMRSFVRRLGALVESFDAEALVRAAYPEKWTVADVLSHLGSAAVIWQRRVDDALAGRPTPPDANPSVWREWDARNPRQKADTALVALDQAVVALEAVGPEDTARFELGIGPLRVDWRRFLRMRLSEQLIHEWDIAVAFDPDAVIAADGRDIIVDDLSLTAGYTARSSGDPRTIAVTTVHPERAFTVVIERDAVEFRSGGSVHVPDLTMPAESFIRLVYGRLDADHTPASVTGDPAALDQLRAVFPGP